MFMVIIMGLMLGLMDSAFDFKYVDQGDESYLTYLMTDWPVYEIFWRGSFLVIAILFGFIFSFQYNKRKDSETLFKELFDNVIPVCITTNNHEVIMANSSYSDIFGPHLQPGEKIKCYESRPGPRCRTKDCPLQIISEGGQDVYVCESIKVYEDNQNKTFIVTATPHRDAQGNQIGILECFQDITERRKLEKEKESLIEQLKETVEKVKTLSGFLPICANCKKIRDDKGYWKQVEAYISEHSEAEFSHSICPDCNAKYYDQLKKHF